MDKQSKIDQLVQNIADVRLAIAHKKMADLAHRYPEVSLAGVSELAHDDIVIKALERELHCQNTILKDIPPKISK